MGSIVDVPGLLVGHHTLIAGRTGCTVVLCPTKASAGVATRGVTLGTHQIDLVRSDHLVKKIDAVLLVGQSAFGLQAVQGVMRYLRERGQGFELQGVIVPTVTAASVFDLDVSSQLILDEAAGFAACVAASTAAPQEGAVGAGTGTAAGKALGREYASQGGIGTASAACSDYTVGVMVVVNSFGCVYEEPLSGKVIAGPRDRISGRLITDLTMLLDDSSPYRAGTSNLLAVVGTDIPLHKAEANWLAGKAIEAFARVVRPTDEHLDGAVVYALSTALPDSRPLPAWRLPLLGSLTADLIASAVVRAVRAGHST